MLIKDAESMSLTHWTKVWFYIYYVTAEDHVGKLHNGRSQ